MIGLWLRESCSGVLSPDLDARSESYPPLTTDTEDQACFDLHAVSGMLAGFRFPAFTEGLDVPGYRLHFLSEDRRAGGQVLALEREGGRLVIDDRPGFHLELPTDGAFLAAGHGGNRLAEIRGIEKRKRDQIPLICFRYTGVRPILTEA